MLPLAFRMVGPTPSPTTPRQELLTGLRQPGLVLHLIGLLLVWTGFGLRFWTWTIERGVTWRGAAGCALAMVSAVLMFWSFAELKSWRLLPRIEGQHELCSTGVYGVVRHPIYLAFDLVGMGVAIAVPSPVVLLGALLVIVAGELRARAEEKALLAAFGERYARYQRRVAGRIPGVY